MATFYVLPPRECLEQAAAEFAGRVFPGLIIPPAAWDAVRDAVLAANPETYPVHREDLPGGDVEADLCDGFGAEPGDDVVEVGLAVGQVGPRVRRWAVAAAVPEPVAGR